MQTIGLAIIAFYQRWISPMLGSACRFEPTCSHYAAEAIRRYGFLSGTGKTCVRLLKCHPFHPGGTDPVR